MSARPKPKKQFFATEPTQRATLHSANRPTLSAALGIGATWTAATLRLMAEDKVDWKHEFYDEARGRVNVETSSVFVEKSLGAQSTLRGQIVYDSISGASPTGGPPRPGSEEVPLASIRDIRRAGNLEFAQRLGNHTVSPKVAYSTENDYESIGLALAESFEFNQKNSTLHLALSRDFDRLPYTSDGRTF